MAQPLARQELERVLAHRPGDQHGEILLARRHLHVAPIEEIGKTEAIAQSEPGMQRRGAEIGVHQERALAELGELVRKRHGERRAAVAGASADDRNEDAAAGEPMLEELMRKGAQRLRPRRPRRQQRLANRLDQRLLGAHLAQVARKPCIHGMGELRHRREQRHEGNVRSNARATLQNQGVHSARGPNGG